MYCNMHILYCSAHIIAHLRVHCIQKWAYNGCSWYGETVCCDYMLYRYVSQECIINSQCHISCLLPTVLCNGTVHFVVELKPRTVRAPIGTNVTLECSTSYNLPIIPLWGIDGADYRVTELPLSYEADGANITFRAFNDTTIFCFFNVFNVSTGNFEVVHSNNVTITATPSQGMYRLLN